LVAAATLLWFLISWGRRGIRNAMLDQCWSSWA
jgi:hypothetical protein